MSSENRDLGFCKKGDKQAGWRAYFRGFVIWTKTQKLEAKAKPEGLEVSGTINICTQPHPALERRSERAGISSSSSYPQTAFS